MGFKEIKRSTLEKGIEKGNERLQRGEEIGDQLLQVKSLLESIEVTDESDMEMVDSLNDSYAEAGEQAFQSEVAEPVDSVHQEIEENKDEISDERSNVESAAEKVREMQSTTDIGRGAAQSVESALRKSISEYEDMEEQTEQAEAQLMEHKEELRNRIANLFG